MAPALDHPSTPTSKRQLAIPATGNNEREGTANSPFNDLPADIDLSILQDPPPQPLTPDTDYCQALLSKGPPLGRQFIDCLQDASTPQVTASAVMGVISIILSLCVVVRIVRKSIKIQLRVIR
ncbi:hypothetical protein J056_002460 [Wallemia ichthyophaga EXF-994]|uniref:Uncharacterized protein n=1 Tax=Wallemia ichthyophaga (strain EXF-994 / CBS 113033) TaxID=1299270 RepID=R9AAP3_WALI9|nr:uncharacterized protein J056_002460 [Wallemia ichthyophaga EXF-994]EOQ99134.1 hypothetical protein J056_002460 [Wallemia ichthyophaga EXF-994]TIB31956.1 hypothetical protein E3P84_02743 [Wallemia ichthyophaga]TIB40739.1 hypothetical protein E3P83_02680 [Wallemia ichthyophaga]